MFTTLAGLLDLPAFRREHQLDDRFGNVRFKTFSVSLIEADDIGHDPTVLAVRIEVKLRLARRRQQSPAWTQLIQPGAVIDVAGLGINGLLSLAPRAARVLLSPIRSLGHAFVIHFALTRLVDEREVGGRRLAQCCGSRGETSRRAGAAGCTSRSSARESGGGEGRRATRVPAQASSR